MRLVRLAWNGAKHERWLAVAQILEELSNKAEPESLAPELIATAIAEKDRSLETVVAHAVAYAAAYNQHRDLEAAQLLETCLQSSSAATPFMRESIIANAGIFQADRRKRIDLAEQWLALLPVNPKALRKRLMVEGAILEAQENLTGALEKVNEIEREILATVEPSRQQSALRPFVKWRAELEQKAACSTAHSSPGI
jgi:hypothetical protein